MMTLYMLQENEMFLSLHRRNNFNIGRKILEGGLFFNFHTLYLQDGFFKKDETNSRT